MKKCIELYRAGFESSPHETEEFKSFAKAFRSGFNKVMKKLGCTNVVYHKMHFEMSANFTTPDGQTWYLSTGDVRQPYLGGFFRKVKGYKDYHGEYNIKFQIEDMERELEENIK